MPSPPAEFAAWILDSLGTGVVAIDAQGVVATLNSGARRILRGPEAGGIGGDCRETFAHAPGVARLLLDALHGSQALSRAELVLRGAEGRPGATLGFTLAPVRDPAGGVRGAAMIFRDLTAFERADEQDRLRERLAALGQMAAGLAHEIRNPLAGIEVLAGLLKRRLGDRPEEQALVAELLGELRDVADTVSASLDFVRPLELARAPAEAVEIVEAALRLARSRVAFAGSVERDYDPDLPRIRCDADRLRALVTDLIVNAFEAMAGAEPRRPGRLRLALRSAVTHGPRRAVRVSADGSARPVAEAPARELVLEVADDGPGVAPEIRDKIFYPFFTTRERGSGVGLATAQKIAASHGGVLELDCPEAGGALFRLRLPLDGESP